MKETNSNTLAMKPKPREAPSRDPMIRPQTLRLDQLQQLIERHAGFAHLLATRPAQVRHLARKVFRRDPGARARFADVDALVAHLLVLLG
jgi:hypothetical protein